MDQDTNLFVQAFWVKCREVIRPEIDAAIADLRGAGHDANVATQEFSEGTDGLPGHGGPSLTLALVPAGAPEGAPHPAIEFHGDAAQLAVDVVTSDGRRKSYELASLGSAQAKAEIEDWLARLATASSD
jgi:hypothetical protein